MSGLSADAALAAMDRYLAFWTSITPERIEGLDAVVTADFHFVDPFNDATGPAQVKAVLHRMYEDCQNPSFRIVGRGLDHEGPAADGSFGGFGYWDFSFTDRQRGELWSFRGVARLTVREEAGVALVSAHTDYWDSGHEFYRKLPLVGAMVRLISGKMAAGKALRRV
jgi:hypothetical protein